VHAGVTAEPGETLRRLMMSLVSSGVDRRRG
jgi:hypothetical protein